MFFTVLAAFPSFVFPWHKDDPDSPHCTALLTMCIKLNNAYAKSVDFMSQDLSPTTHITAIPFILKHLSATLNIETESIEWIPLVIPTPVVFRFTAGWIAQNLALFSTTKTRFDYALVTLHHLLLTKTATVLTSKDLIASDDIRTLLESLLQVLATNPDEKERGFIVTQFKHVVSLFKDPPLRTKILLEHVMTHKAVNVRSFGIYMYKNELVETRKLDPQGSMTIDPRVSKLLFTVSSSLFESPSFSGHWMENDDVFFEMVPLVAQCINFLSYLRQFSRVNGGDSDAHFRAIATDFVGPLRQRTKLMLHARENALKVMKVDPAQCNASV
ncbi:hypothetical protein HDU98_007869 [Podochytrium sp. JEL0797]|nr:hypothetical protein HDU98_007869 [Podochytrium sp. JEL0797]